MKRRLFNLAAAVSLVLCVGAVALWVRSYWYLDGEQLWPDAQRTWIIESGEGGLFFQQSRATAPIWQQRAGLRYPSGRQHWSRQIRGFPWGFGPWSWRMAGFAYGSRSTPAPWSVAPPGTSITDHCVRVPHAFLVAAFALLPVILLYRSLRARHIRHHDLCPTCGYDLRATPERCPECGTATAPKPAETAA